MALTPRLIVRLPAPALRGEGAIGVHIDAKYLDPVRFVATSGNLATDFNTGDSFAGLTLATGDRFLYQPASGGVTTPGVTVGIYVVNPGLPTRATDADTGSEIFNAAVLVTSGNPGAGQSWINTNATAPVVGTDNIIFRQFDTSDVKSSFGTRTDAAGSDIAGSVNMLETLAFAAAGDGGGAIWKRVSTPPSHAGKFQSLDGTWWEINSARLDAQMFGAVGDGTTNDRTALADADGAATAQGKDIYINKTYRVNSALTMNSLLTFGPAGKIKPASGITVTLAGGFTASPTRQLFDLSLGGEVWPTRECPVTARNYGAVGDNVTNDRVALQHLIDCCLYFQKAQAVRLDAGTFFISGGPLIVNYGSGSGSLDVLGAGQRYDATSIAPGFNGTYLRSDSYGNLLEVHGGRAMRIDGIGFEGPFKDFIANTLFGNSTPAVGAGDPYDLKNWVPAAAWSAGALNRYKMCCGVHIDPRGGVKPVAVAKTAVRLVETIALTTTHSDGNTVQGVVLAAGDRILQAVAFDVDGWPGFPSNGVYVVQAAGVAPVRATDMDIAAEFADASVSCSAGTYAGQQWVCNTASANITVGTTNVDFRPFDGTLSYADYTYPAWTGIATQYGKLLSSAITIANCIFRGFGAAVAVKGCNDDGNGDFIRMEYCGGLYNVYTMVWGQTQGRDQGMVGCQFNTTRTHISSGVVGKQLGKGHFSATNCEFSGCLDVLDIPTMSITGGVSLTTCSGEGMYRIGRCNTSSTSSGSFEIAGGSFGFQNQAWIQRVPRWIIDCRVTGVQISPAPMFLSLYSPLIINGDPTNCIIWAKILNPLWLSNPPGTATPATIDISDAILLHSTMSVLFINTRQGPWTGGGFNEAYNITTGGSRAARFFGRHMASSVATPIPFCATTVAPADASGFDGAAEPIAVGLGRYVAEKPLNNAGHFTGAPVQSGRTLTLVLASTPTLSNAQNSGYVPGSIIYDITTGSLFVIQTLATATITAKLLNNFSLGTITPYSPIGPAGNAYFIPTGHYVPAAGLEMTYTSASANVTYQRCDGTTSDGAQLPVGAAKVVNNSTDAMTPILRANSAIVTSSVAGTIVMAGNARLTKTERCGLFFVPRP